MGKAKIPEEKTDEKCMSKVCPREFCASISVLDILCIWQLETGKQGAKWELMGKSLIGSNRVGKKQSGGNSIPRENLDLGKPLWQSR